MIVIEEFEKLGLSITWKLLYICLREKQMETRCVIDYAIGRIEKGDEHIEIFELAGAYVDEKGYICDILFHLSERETTQFDFEKRKLRAVVVQKILEKKLENFIDGLMELTDLWISLDYPDDSPHIIQGRGNSITASEYYTQENYDYLYKKMWNG